VDSDCVPAAGLLDAYFDPPPGDGVGVLAGAVISDARQDHFLARYACDRGFLDQESGIHTAEDAAATANLAVRRSAFEEVGGFEEGIRSGGDVDLCRRLVAAGWTIERRPQAIVTHLHRESLPDLLGAIARYGSGANWLNERYPGSAPQWPVVPGLVGAAKDIATNVARRRFEEAAFRGVDSLGLVAHAIGYRRSNDAPKIRC
jgi:GT2 family glycosyltransferase